MSDLKIPARFQNVEETLYVAFNIRIWVCDGISHACLSRQVHDLVEAFLLEKRIDALFVAEVHPYETQISIFIALYDVPFYERLTQPIGFQPPIFQRHVVIFIDIVQPDDLVAPFSERPA